jgi:hypothetical protein
MSPRPHVDSKGLFFKGHGNARLLHQTLGGEFQSVGALATTGSIRRVLINRDCSAIDADVRFAPDSGGRADSAEGPSCAISRRACVTGYG